MFKRIKVLGKKKWQPLNLCNGIVSFLSEIRYMNIMK